MAICPSGHESASDDYCDVCGTLIGAAVLTPFAQAPGSVPGQAPDGVSPAEGGCPRCGVPRVGQFCESCGFDFHAASTGTPSTAGVGPPIPPTAAPPPTEPPPLSAPSLPPPSSTTPNGAAWTVVVTADRAYYDSVQEAGGPDAAAIGFPAYCPERRFRLAGTEVRVGRRSESRGVHPEIDLTGPPADPGVSRLHVVLVGAPDGTWSVVDPGSANGTLVNGDEIPAGESVRLRDGDVIHLGAWTALTVTSG
jgi:FHA domain